MQKQSDNQDNFYDSSIIYELTQLPISPKKKQQNEVVHKQGNIKNLPEQPKILTKARRSFFQSASKNQSPVKYNENGSKRSHHVLTSSSHPKQMFYSTKNLNNQEMVNFYEYCGKQIQNLADQNRKLEKDVNLIEQRVAQSQIKNRMVQQELDRSQRRIQQYQSEQREQKQKIERLTNKITALKKRETKSENNSHKQPKIELEQLYRQKQTENNERFQLLNKMRSSIKQNEQLKQQKSKKEKIIVHMLGEIERERNGLNKFGGDSEIVGHLWDVKDIQYGNLMHLINNI